MLDVGSEMPQDLCPRVDKGVFDTGHAWSTLAASVHLFGRGSKDKLLLVPCAVFLHWPIECAH